MNKRHLQRCFISGKLWLILFLSIYIFYTRVNTYFAELFGISLNVAEKKDNHIFYDFCIELVLITSLSIILYLCYSWFESLYLKSVLVKLRVKLFTGIMKKSIPEFYRDGDTGMTSILINDINLIERNYIKPLISTTKECLTLLISLIVMLQINWIATVFVLAVSFVPILLPNLFMKSLQSKMSVYSHEMEKFTLKTNDFLSGYELFRNANAEKRIVEKYSTYNMEVGKKKKSAFQFIDILSNTVAISSVLITIGVLVVGMFLAIFKILTVGEVFALSFISSGVSVPLGTISNNIPKITSSKTLVDKYNKLIPELTASKHSIDKIENSIEFKNVNLTISDKCILNKINLSLDIGKKYVFLGESGSGKSTILKLIMGYFNEYEGDILLDEKNIRDIDEESIYENITYVTQNNTLFEGSLKDNVSLFESNTTDEDVIETLTRAELLNRVKDNGINAMISEGGSNFSGGEKQRIGIARALLRDSDVLFLDETTSALDTANYQKIEELFLSMKDKTIITVTHRLDEDILKGYDKIIAFKNGTVVEEGTFEDLIVKNGYFKLLYDSQIS